MVTHEPYDYSSDRWATINVCGIGRTGVRAAVHCAKVHAKEMDFVAVDFAKELFRVPDEFKRIGICNFLHGRFESANIAANAARDSLNARNIIFDAMDLADMNLIFADLKDPIACGATPIITASADVGARLAISFIILPADEPNLSRLIALRNIEGHGAMVLMPEDRLIETAAHALPDFDRGDLPLEMMKIGMEAVVLPVLRPGLVRLDFGDMEALLQEMGCTLMGLGIAQGNDRAEEAVQQAITCPLLGCDLLAKAFRCLIHIAGSENLLMKEVVLIAEAVHERLDSEATSAWGVTIDESLQDKIRVTILATDFDEDIKPIMLPGLHS
jgi:cell division protein FtsZ